MSFMFSCSGDISLRRRPQSTDCARKIYNSSLSAILFHSFQDTSGLIHKTVLSTPSFKFLVNHLQ